MKATIFDRSGSPQFFIEDETFYDLSGQPVAFLDDENIVKFSGYHAGWLRDGYVRDSTGGAVGFIEGAKGGPPLPKIINSPILTVGRPAPIAPMLKTWTKPPVFGNKWASRTLNQFFRGRLL